MVTLSSRARGGRGRSTRDPEGRMSLTDHLRELRVRLVRSVLAIVVGTIVAAFLYKGFLFPLLVDPINSIKDDHPGLTLNFGGISDSFTFALKICAMAGVFIASPVWLYNLWGFVAPGLHKRERAYGIAFVGVSVPLFLGGAALAYLFLPKGFDLLIGFNPAPGEVANIISLDNYMSFVLRMFLVFGIAFVMPVFLVGLNLAGIVSGRQLLRAWRPVILGSFVFAAVATPSGDPWTMTALAVPMLLLYYVAAGLSLLTDRRRRNQRIDGVDYGDLDDEEASPLQYQARPLDDPDDLDTPSDPAGPIDEDDPDRA
ncbi:MAG: twin-arginine translocase subunit TatC [Sporichthyaceae bacterium]